MALTINKDTIVEENTIGKSKNEMNSICLRIIPILLYCQANKGDLSMYETWKNSEDAGKKLFFAYYSGLFSRVLFMIEGANLSSEELVRNCEMLLDKYNWYGIQCKDIEIFHSDGPYGCEVPEALGFLDGVDNVAWNDSGFGNGRDAVCLKMERGSWTFADVRGAAAN